MNPVSARLLSQQLASPQFKEPAELVSWFGAMQAQDIRSMRWAVAMRTKRPSYKAFEGAFNEGKLIRAHLLRCTWQIVAAEDYHWIRQVIYSKGLSVMNGWTSSMGFKFTDKEKDRTLSTVEKVVGERGMATEDEITESLLQAGIPKEHLVYSHHLRMAELEGLVCSGPLGPQSTYALVRKRVGEFTPIDRDEALGKLARKYFRSHGPATLEDFAWWSGLSGRDCKRGIAVCGNAIETITQKGREYPFLKTSLRNHWNNFMQQENDKTFGERLLDYLLETSTAAGLLKGRLLSTPDIDEAWLRYAPSFYGDAVRNFNSYPEYCLACAGYLGMAIAYLWDKDWAKYMDCPYDFFQGERGFDDMDDHITGEILKESKHSVKAMESVSANAYHFLMKESPEPGTAEAYKLFLATVEVVYKIGAAIELCRLGYKFEKVDLT